MATKTKPKTKPMNVDISESTLNKFNELKTYYSKNIKSSLEQIIDSAYEQMKDNSNNKLGRVLSETNTNVIVQVQKLTLQIDEFEEKFNKQQNTFKEYSSNTNRYLQRLADEFQIITKKNKE
jgi:hypothetical protein